MAEVLQALQNGQAASLLRERLPLSIQWLIGVVLAGMLCLALLLGLQPLIMLGILGLAAGYLLLKRADFAIVAYTLLIIFLVVRVKVDADGAPDAAEAISGMLLFGVSFGWALKLRLFEGRYLSKWPEQLLIQIFLVWILFVSVGGLIYWDNTWSSVLREFANFLPLFAAPLIYLAAIPAESKQEKWFILFLGACGVAIFLFNILKVRQNLVQAYYLFETGRSNIDPTFSLLVLFVVFALFMVRPKSIQNKLLGALAILAGVVMLMSIYRTIWLAFIFGFPFLYLSASKKERRVGIKKSLLFGLVSFLLFIPVFLSVRLVRLLTEGYILRFLSSAKLGTDLSLVNRYVEWAMLWKTIRLNPIVGYGAGAHYKNFNIIWYSNVIDGFTHNGFLFVLFKSGLIGFLLVYGAYFLFIWRGWKLSKSLLLSDTSRAYIRACLAFLMSMMVVNYTLNIFGGKTDLFWIGIIWGYFLSHEIRLAKLTSMEISEEVITDPV